MDLLPFDAAFAISYGIGHLFNVISLLTACSNDGISLSNRTVDREAGLIELGTMDQAPDMDQELINFDRL